MSEQPILTYGGQAVIEGVMMRGRKRVAVAVRAPNGQIVVHEEALNSALYSGALSRIPFVRGLSLIWDSVRHRHARLDVGGADQNRREQPRL